MSAAVGFWVGTTVPARLIVEQLAGRPTMRPLRRSESVRFAMLPYSRRSGSDCAAVCGVPSALTQVKALGAAPPRVIDISRTGGTGSVLGMSIMPLILTTR